MSSSASSVVTTGRREFGNRDILINDLDKFVDHSLLQKHPSQTNLWKPIPFVSEEFSGVMLGEGGGPAVQPIAIRLQAKGKYRIFLGLYGAYNCGQMRVRLSQDASCDTIPITSTGQVEQWWTTTVISETFWKEADLTGQDLVVEGSGSGGPQAGALAYVRLDAIAERKDFYPLVVTNDGGGVGLVSRPEDLLKRLDESIPEGSPLRTFIWSTGCADNCNFPTKVGQFYPNAGFAYGPGEWEEWARNMGVWKDKGWDSLQLVRDYARKRQWEFQVYIRMEAFRCPFPFDAQENSAFFNEHPQYHCLDRAGLPVNRLSYAYPEVQAYMVRLIKEIVDYGPDGVCLCFTRGVPLVLYEPIMVEGFKKQYDVDPRQLDELDPRWLDYQGAVLTSFVKQVRKTLKPSQRLSVIVPGNELDCRRWGLDVATWVKEGMIDDLLPAGYRFANCDVHIEDPGKLDFRYFARLTGRERIRLIPMLNFWQNDAEIPAWEQLMRSFLDQGADAYCVWDGWASTSITQGQIGTTMKDYRGPPPPALREIKLLRLQGFRIDRYHYFEVI
jgi:hypothetical protein